MALTEVEIEKIERLAYSAHEKYDVFVDAAIQSRSSSLTICDDEIII